MTKLKMNPMGENEMTEDARKANEAAIIAMDRKIDDARRKLSDAIYRANRMSREAEAAV